MNPWRAGCGESRTSGSEGGPEKPTSEKAGRALRSDPYTEHAAKRGDGRLLGLESKRLLGSPSSLLESVHADGQLAAPLCAMPSLCVITTELSVTPTEDLNFEVGTSS